jgi:hypothetical protein
MVSSKPVRHKNSIICSFSMQSQSTAIAKLSFSPCTHSSEREFSGTFFSPPMSYCRQFERHICLWVWEFTLSCFDVMDTFVRIQSNEMNNISCHHNLAESFSFHSSASAGSMLRHWKWRVKSRTSATTSCPYRQAAWARLISVNHS